MPPLKSKCPTCGGSGMLSEYNAQTGLAARGQCPRCGGTGVVTISSTGLTKKKDSNVGQIIFWIFCFIFCGWGVASGEGFIKVLAAAAALACLYVIFRLANSK